MQLCFAIYDLTEAFPKNEIFSLTSQLRRAAVSIASHIAEGHGTTGQLIQFLCTARGSTFELQTQLIIAQGIAPLRSGMTWWGG